MTATLVYYNSSYQGSDATSNSINLGNDVQDGDVAYVMVHKYSAAADTLPTGWALREESVINSASRQSLYSKTLTTADNGTWFTVTGGGYTRRPMILAIVRGGEHDTSGQNIYTGGTSGGTIPSLTPAEDDSLVIAFVAARSGTINVSPPSGWTEVVGFSTGMRLEMFQRDAAASGGTPTASDSYTTSGAAAQGVYAVAVSPVSANLDATVTAEPGTGTALMVDPVVTATSPDRTVSAVPMTASVTMPGGIGGGNVVPLYPTDDTYVVDGSATNYSSDTTLSLVSGRTAFMHLPAIGEGQYEVETRLYLDPTGSMIVPTTLNVYSVDEAWSAATISGTNEPSTTLVRSVTITDVVGGRIIINITGADTGNGIAISGGGSYHSLEATGTATDPYIIRSVTTIPPWVTIASEPLLVSATMPAPTVVAVVVPPQTVGITASPATANATMPESTVVASGNVSLGSTPMTGTAVMADPVVAILLEGNVLAEPLHAQATMTNNNEFTMPVSTYADPMGAAVVVNDAAVETTEGAIVRATPMTTKSVWKQPALVNELPITISELGDKYAQRVLASDPYKWFRLNELSGTTGADRMSPTGRKVTYSGVQIGNFDAPEGRHSVYFDGNARITQDEGGFQDVIAAQSTLEFSFRTNKADTFVMIGQDERAGSVSNTPLTPVALHLKGGKVAYRQYGTNGYSEFVGFRNIADGEWHQVVVRYLLTPSQNDLVQGVEIWIDGTFEIRRWTAVPLTGFPDYIGSRPALVGGYSLSPLPLNENFVGDMTEVITYRRRLTEDEMPRHYYDFMGWNPIEATSMDAFAFTPAEHSGRGNQKRALYLWWDDDMDRYPVGGGVGNNKMNFDPLNLDGIDKFVRSPKDLPVELEGYKVFSMPVVGGYRDPVYDLPTLIDLEYHVDMDDYDVIMFADWPDEGTEEAGYAYQFPRWTHDKERLLRQLRDANDNGVGLFVTHPRLAVDLGIIDRVEYVPTLKESYGTIFVNPNNLGIQGNAHGLYDYGSAVKFPWGITASAGLEGSQGNVGGVGTGSPATAEEELLQYKAYFYDDNNFNNKFRVRALIDGLTNIPSYMIEDAVYHVDYDVWGDDFAALDLIDRREGLRIGDEFIFNGTNPASMSWDSQNMNGFRYGRPYGYYAVPLANVKAGTVVTTFGTTHWRGTAQVENPYKDYATTIVLDRGDALAGRPVGGRIFVSFTESPYHPKRLLPVDVLPGSEWDDGTAAWPTRYTPETAAQRDWEFSGTRVSVSTDAINKANPYVDVQMPDGSYARYRAGGEKNTLFSARYNNLFGRAYVTHFDMTSRGLWWVGRGEKPEEGEKRVAATPMVATAEMPQPAVVAQRDAGYNAQPMVALAQMTRVAESTVGDVDVTMLPMTAYAEFTGYSRVVSAEPMVAEATMVENFEFVHTTGEQVVLTLHGVDATLYLKEEA